MNFAHKAKDNTGIVHIKLQLYADLFLNPITEPCLIILQFPCIIFSRIGRISECLWNNRFI